MSSLKRETSGTKYHILISHLQYVNLWWDKCQEVCKKSTCKAKQNHTCTDVSSPTAYRNSWIRPALLTRLSNKRTNRPHPSPARKETPKLSPLFIYSTVPQQTFGRFSWGSPGIDAQDEAEGLEGEKQSLGNMARRTAQLYTWTQ